MDKKEEIIEALKKAYWKEIETVLNYLAISVNIDGIRAQEIRESLSDDIEEELEHAQKLAERIKELDGHVPGSSEFRPEQKTNQPSKDTTDLNVVVQGVLDAEEDAISHYKHIIEITDGIDYVTQDLAIELLADEEGHRRLFKGFMKGLKADK